MRRERRRCPCPPSSRESACPRHQPARARLLDTQGRGQRGHRARLPALGELLDDVEKFVHRFGCATAFRLRDPAQRAPLLAAPDGDHRALDLGDGVRHACPTSKLHVFLHVVAQRHTGDVMKPIGYWLRHVHELIETSFGEALATESLTRRHWQVLNTIALGARTLEDLDTALAPFVVEDGSMAPIVADLRGRGWVSDFALTDEGRVAHARVEEQVKAMRERIRDGISDDDYVTTVRTLERCAAISKRLRTSKEYRRATG